MALLGVETLLAGTRYAATVEVGSSTTARDVSKHGRRREEMDLCLRVRRAERWRSEADGGIHEGDNCWTTGTSIVRVLSDRDLKHLDRRDGHRYRRRGGAWDRRKDGDLYVLGHPSWQHTHTRRIHLEGPLGVA